MLLEEQASKQISALEAISDSGAVFEISKTED